MWVIDSDGNGAATATAGDAGTIGADATSAGAATGWHEDYSVGGAVVIGWRCVIVYPDGDVGS